MKNEIPFIIWKRFIFFGLILLIIMWAADRAALNSVLKEEKNNLVLEALQDTKVLSDELNSLFHGVNNDFVFFENQVLKLINLDPNSLEFKVKVDLLVKLLETHPGYFKVRLTNSNGQEVLKFAQENDHHHFILSKNLYDLSKQPFYIGLNSVKENEFYYSPMEPNIINGVIEKPLRPTVRISKRVQFKNGEKGLLIFNIDGKKILKLFHPDRHTTELAAEKALLDDTGSYLASFPFLSDELYSSKKKSLPKIFNVLKEQKDLQGAIESKNEIIVYSKFILPNTSESWFLITRVPSKTWYKIIRDKRLTWIFWEFLISSLLLVWYWKQEKKRYKDEVVEVLLKERNEFIQNVSHQLKTPLAILINSLDHNESKQYDWIEIKKEMHHLVKVVDDMLLLALVDTNPVIPLKKENILEILIDAIAMTGAKAKEKGVVIKLNVDEKMQELNVPMEKAVMGDLLISALMNLIDNAIDYSPQGETIDIFLAFQSPNLIIKIKDNGPGISEEMLPRLFVRFARGSNNKLKGTGLGLSITKKIIEMHKGEISLVEYKNGTTFQIIL